MTRSGASIEDGTAFSGTTVTAWATRESRTYTPTGQVATVANGASNTTTNAYDPLDRLLSVTDPVGRVTRNEYDLAGQLTRIIRAYGTGLQQDYARYTYSDNGQRLSVRDANDNRSEYVYDGFDRLIELHFPEPTLGSNQASATDWEGYGYDANSNRTSYRLRSGETIAYSYDNLNRESVRDIPGGTSADVYTIYDLAGRRLSARFVSAGGSGIIYGYDTAGRLTSEQSTIGTTRTLNFGYDIASNRTSLLYTSGGSAAYAYDALNRVDQIGENGSFAGVQLLADFAYDTRGRRTAITRGNGAATSYGYDNASRLTSLSHDFAGSSNDIGWSFSYTTASQVSQRVSTNDDYSWAGTTDTVDYDRNGLNQYTQVDSASFTYDARGNLTSDGSRSFCYDLENRLIGVHMSAGDACSSPTHVLSYDPLGRLRRFETVGGAVREFLYDGDALVTEYDGAGTALMYYAHGPGVDEPVFRWDMVAAQRRQPMHMDHLGSLVAISADGGARIDGPYAYGPYGEPSAWAGERFRYTGQIALPEVRLYHYKARAYDPVLGRFLQTDPIGYDDDLNLYAYVQNDPLNNTDPTGRIKLSLGLEGEVTAGLGLGGGVDIQVSFPVAFIDPDAQFDVGWSIYGSARAGIMIGGGLTASAEMGSVADTPTLGLEFDAIAGSEVLQVGTSIPVEFRDGQMVDADRPGGRASGSAGVRSRTRVGPSTGGGSEGITGRWTGSVQRVVEHTNRLLSPQKQMQPQFDGVGINSARGSRVCPGGRLGDTC